MKNEANLSGSSSKLSFFRNHQFVWLVLITFNLLSTQAYNYQMLSGIPIQFSMLGATTYTPTSGGVAIPGYILSIGFNKYQWIGVKFMSLTSQSNYDVLIFQRSTVPNGGTYECTVKDYYISSGRQSALMGDSINNMDQVVKSYSPSNKFQIQIPRTLGNTNGQDWQSNGVHGDFVDICFFTSDIEFSTTTWSRKYEACYGYSLQNYVSRWVGYQIGSHYVIDGVSNCLIYGGIDGPLLQMNLFFYRKNPTLSNTEVLLKIGEQIDSVVGFDYQRCVTNKGDYFGFSVSNLKQDLIYSGYNDQNCQIVTSAFSFKLFFSRNLQTYDNFDKSLLSSNKICLIFGTNQNCYTLSSRAIFPIMSVNSALSVSQGVLLPKIAYIICIITVLILRF